MPSTKGQLAVLRVIAAARSSGSYVAGSIPLNENEPRLSDDIDIFHDIVEGAAECADRDAALLQAAGYTINWIRRAGGVHSLIASRDGEDVKLEWVADSDYRYFPTMTDPVFGYTLHPVDLALNKTMAAATRRELRDLIDLLTIHDRVLPLGAAVLAAVEKSPGFTPEGLIAEIRRNLHHPVEEWRQIATTEPIDAGVTVRKLLIALNEAETFVKQMPTDLAGRLFVDADGKIVQPDPTRLNDYVVHTGKRRGHWPDNRDVTASMMKKLHERRFRA